MLSREKLAQKFTSKRSFARWKQNLKSRCNFGVWIFVTLLENQK